MRIRIPLFLYVCLLNYIAYSQTLNFTKRTKAEVFQWERSKDGILKDSTSFGLTMNPTLENYGSKSTKTFIFKRDSDVFYPKLHVWYHFDFDTKQLLGIRYHWGLYNPSFNPNKQKDILKQLSKKEAEFKAKFETLKKDLSNIYGKPVKEKISDRATYTAEAIWEDNEKFIVLSVRFDRLPSEYSDYSIMVVTTFK